MKIVPQFVSHYFGIAGDSVKGLMVPDSLNVCGAKMRQEGNNSNGISAAVRRDAELPEIQQQTAPRCLLENHGLEETART